MIARKRFGQHFLEPAWVAKVVTAIAPAAGDDFIEIGPGRAAITRPLAAGARSVTAFEIDRDLAALLRGSAPSNVTVVEGDFLE
jgi:16S rRNA (adenine1518-N6/adenine1519-N6)-dimethyltransferase